MGETERLSIMGVRVCVERGDVGGQVGGITRFMGRYVHV